MSFEILGIKYCCALYGNGKLDDARARLLVLDTPDWIKHAGAFSHENGAWNLAVGVATEDEEWRQDDDVGDFVSKMFPFLHDLSSSDDATLALHLSYSAKNEPAAEFSPDTLSILASLKIRLRVEFRNENRA